MRQRGVRMPPNAERIRPGRAGCGTSKPKGENSALEQCKASPTLRHASRHGPQTSSFRLNDRGIAGPPALALHAVACTFVSKDDVRQRYTAVSHVTLAVGAGEFVSVVGPTGCGKSTLLNVAAGLLVPSAGTVTVFGEPLVGIKRRAG